ncbi:MAG: 2-C-methyl-D-erythritol 4-phosphate cytidylyltransferase [Lachnospiraceae bacterium]|nr:2-C-methyl-D-erythritol 4-phosphate cytidylyltransferase [Lachnospiraceae bacterium]
MNIALILSGGTGSRVGADIPKQYIEVKGQPIISYCLQTFLVHEEIDAVCIVADEAGQKYILEKSEGMTGFCEKFRGFSAPGATRQLSIFSGLEDIRKWADGEDFVLVHDAARPLLSAEMISQCFAAAKGHDGVLPVLPMKDTVYFSESGERVDQLLNRSNIFAGQAPEVFVLGKYYDANVRLLPEEILKINGSTEPAILAGMDIAMIPGEEQNFKITTRMDLDRFEEVLNREKM